jgi:hypothetical protein
MYGTNLPNRGGHEPLQDLSTARLAQHYQRKRRAGRD